MTGLDSISAANTFGGMGRRSAPRADEFFFANPDIDELAMEHERELGSCPGCGLR